MTSIERTAYPRFKRLITARELHVFFTSSEEERVWTEEVTDSDEHQLALLVALKSYQRMGCFPKAYDVPAQVVEWRILGFSLVAFFLYAILQGVVGGM